MHFARPTAALLFLSFLSGQAAHSRYAPGQVWEYRTRTGDEGSLLKIQSIEHDPAFENMGPVYHISVVRFRLSNPHILPALPHAPVSEATLDASVTNLSTESVAFPDAEAGIAEWKRAEGGVYTIPVADIIAGLDLATEEAPRP